MEIEPFQVFDLREKRLTEARRILIVDDEQLARQRVARYVRQFGQEFSIEEAESGIRAVELIASFRPEIIFLDVEMPGLNGLEVLQQFEERPFQVIFQTAYGHFAIQAFEEQACDYLLKPFTAGRLHQALSRALNQAADDERLRALEAQLAIRKGYLRKLTVKQGNRMRIVAADEIFCFISRDHCTCVYFEDGVEGICDLSLVRLAERLDPQEFRQFHRNSIVRVSAIAAINCSSHGEMWMELLNGMKIQVSRSNQQTAKEMVRRIMGEK